MSAVSGAIGERYGYIEEIRDFRTRHACPNIDA
jgi:hypothetical protein